MSWPRLRFVSAPHMDADVRFDLNADPQGGAWCRLVHEDFTLGSPELLGEPDGVATELGLRQIGMAVRIAGSRADAMAVQSQLARELGRHRNWLLVQFGPTAAPLWFRTYRSQPGELGFDYIFNDTTRDVWQAALTLSADPYAEGERVTLPAQSVSADPTAATGCRVTLPPVVGDAPAALRVQARVSGAEVQSTQQGMVGSRWMLAVAAFPSRRDRVLLRAVRRTAGAASSAAFVEFGSGSATVRTRSYPLWAAGSGGTQAAWFDLGTIQTPLRTVVPDDLLASGTSSPAVAVHLSQAGQGDIGLDAIMFVPADDAGDGRGSVCLTEFGDPAPTTSSSATSGDRVVWDGDAETVFRRPQVSAESWGAPDSLTAQVAGTYVEAHPVLVNDLYVMPHVRDAATARVPATGDVLAATVEVVVSYRPRWLWLGAG